jgi:hypothetical protein
MYRPKASVFVGEPTARPRTEDEHGYRILLGGRESGIAFDASLPWDRTGTTPLAEYAPAGELLASLERRLPISIVLTPDGMREALERGLAKPTSRPLLQLWVTSPVTDEVLEAVKIAESLFDGPIEVQLGLAQSMRRPLIGLGVLREALTREQRIRIRIVSEVAPPIAHEVMNVVTRCGNARAERP